MEDLQQAEHLAKLHNLLEECPTMSDAILMFKVWLRQRNLQNSRSFNGFLISMLMLYLVQKRYLNVQMSSYQLFRVTLNYISSEEILKGISLSTQNSDDISEFLQYFPIVFLDHSGQLNLTGRVTLGGFREIQHEAKLTLKSLADNMSASFNVLFLQQVPFTLKFDYYFSINTDSYLKKKSNEIEDKTKSDNILISLQQITEDALNSRLSLVVYKYPEIKPWQIGQKPLQSNLLMGGLMIIPQTAFNLIERGPSAEDKEAAEIFRTLWKGHTDLWQMNDGSVVEAIEWNLKKDKIHTLPKIQISQLANIHFDIQEDDVKFIIDQIIKKNHI